MKAMVLAAGQGTRLHPLTERTPKALVAVSGRPMIEYSLLLLKRFDIRDIIINLHHLGSQIESYLGDGTKWGLHITYSQEPELLDTGGGLLKAKRFLDDGTFIVINTDVLIDLSLSELIAFHNQKRAAATLVLRPDPLADQYGSMEIDSDGRIQQISSGTHGHRTVCANHQAYVHRGSSFGASGLRPYGARRRRSKVQHNQGHLSAHAAATRKAFWLSLRRFLAGPWNGEPDQRS